MKHELILQKVLFIFGLALELFSLVMLGIQIYHTLTTDFSSHISHIPTLVSYTIIQYSTIIFKIIISAYAIYGHRHIDDVINPLFTFTILYGIFVVFQSINYFVDSSLIEYSLISTINTIVDIVVASAFLIITLVFKIDDWRPYKKESK